MPARPALSAARGPVIRGRSAHLDSTYGSNAYGIHDAAAIFFATTPDSLSLPQAALLIGLLNSPSAYNPLQHPERASRCLQHVLTRLQRTGYLSADERKEYDGLRAEEMVDVLVPGR